MSESGNRVHQSVRVRVSSVVKKNGSGERVRWARWAVGLGQLGQSISIFFSSEFFFLFYFYFSVLNLNQLFIHSNHSNNSNL